MWREVVRKGRGYNLYWLFFWGYYSGRIIYDFDLIGIFLLGRLLVLFCWMGTFFYRDRGE